MKGILLILMIVFIGSNVCLSQQDPASFLTFWTDFRKAVLMNDTSTIISFTTLPIRTQGPYDWDPIIKYGRKQFIKVFMEFLQMETGTNRNDFNERQIDLIRKTETIDPRTFGNRIGNMEFKCIKGQWKLVFIYYWVIK
jgi:hypothetical protein